MKFIIKIKMYNYIVVKMRVGKIYKIIHLHSDIVYVGSTFQKRLTDRYRSHKTVYNKCSISKYIKEYGIKNFKILLINEYNCIDKYQLYAYEQLWINNLNCINVNSSLPWSSTKWYKKLFYENNKEELKEKYINYRDNNLEAIQEKSQEYNKNYRENNKEALKEKRKEKITCECGVIIVKAGKSRHIKTAKHIKLMELKELV